MKRFIFRCVSLRHLPGVVVFAALLAYLSGACGGPSAAVQQRWRHLASHHEHRALRLLIHCFTGGDGNQHGQTTLDKWCVESMNDLLVDRMRVR